VSRGWLCGIGCLNHGLIDGLRKYIGLESEMTDKNVFTDSSLEAYYEKLTKTDSCSGFPLKEIYAPDDVKDIDYEKDIGDAGKYPFTRGIHADMYRGRLWTKRQGWGYGAPKDTNEQLKFLFQEGNTGLTIFADNPTTAGVDPDHPMSEGEVGRTGASFCSLQDMEDMLEGIPQDKVSMTLLGASCAARITLCLYLAAAEKKGLDISKLRGTISNDPLHSHYCRGKEFNPIDLCVSSVVDVMEYCVKEVPLWNTTSVNSYDLRETGINAPQEVAFGLGIAISYINGALKRGLSIDDIAPRISFYCCGGPDFFEEIAKLRAMRRMWSRIVRDRFGAKDPRSWKFRFAAQTAGSSLTAQQPLNNITRVAYEALALVLSGAQSVFCCTYDEAESLPTWEAQRTALRTQQILAHETGVARVADPLGGSYYVEYLTSKIEEEAARIMQEIEDMGGMTEALRTEWVDREVDKAALDLQRKVEEKENVVVGVNAFTIPLEEDMALPGGICRIPSRTEQEQVARVTRLKHTRNNENTSEALKRLRERALNSDNLISSIIEATKANATMEEMLGTIREASGYSYDPFNMRTSPF